jgi:2-amino-4-hydroxy-6-hydroxymethyldihydropteridine diphosphokinase
MNEAYLLLGSNVGDRLSWFKKATGLIEEKCGKITICSSVYETAAWGLGDQPAFLNKVLRLHTALLPHELLSKILDIETGLGRHRHEKWGPRIIDIDLLFYNQEIINTPALIIPHPFLHKRRFTLVPLVEIAPQYVHPLLHKTTTELLHECVDPLDVKMYK